MKIGIITYHRSHNYGAVLQAYGLKTYLLSCGHEVDIVDYWPHYRDEMYGLVDLSILKEKEHSLKNKIGFLIKTFLIFRKKLQRYERFQKFISKYFDVSLGEVKYRDAQNISDQYDLIFYGSDQIWRKNNYRSFKGFDSVYWGEYPKSKGVQKVAYAASMGVLNNSQEDANFYKKVLRNFNCISVREESLLELLRPHADQEIYQVLDPAFLLDKNEWREIASNNNTTDQYLLFYHLVYSEEAVKIANTIAEERNIKIIEINGEVKPFRNSKRYKQTSGPSEFIGLIDNASYVVSTSFHGVVFSIIMQKEFVALGMKNNAGRVKSLLSKLDISERYLDNTQTYRHYEPIKYQVISEVLNEEVNKAKEFLKSAVRDVKF